MSKENVFKTLLLLLLLYKEFAHREKKITKTSGMMKQTSDPVG